MAWRRGQALSEDLRARVDEGVPPYEAAEVFAVSVSYIYKALERRREAGKGAIVNLSSGASRSARAGGSHYAGSKAPLNMMTEVLAIELGPHGIRINNVLPGLILDRVLTEETAEAHPYANQMLRGTPLGRTHVPLSGNMR